MSALARRGTPPKRTSAAFGSWHGLSRLPLPDGVERGGPRCKSHHDDRAGDATLRFSKDLPLRAAHLRLTRRPRNLAGGQLGFDGAGSALLSADSALPTDEGAVRSQGLRRFRATPGLLKNSLRSNGFLGLE